MQLLNFKLWLCLLSPTASWNTKIRTDHPGLNFSLLRSLFLMIRLQPLRPPGHWQPSVIHSSPPPAAHALKITDITVKFKIQAQVTAWKIQIRFDQVDTPWTLLQLVLNVDLSLALKRNQHIQFYLSSIIKLRISKY